MKIQNKSEHDPVAALGMPNNYTRWALEAIEEVAGGPGLTIILREAGLARLQDNPPPDDDHIGEVTMGQYADLNAAILNFFGRAAKSMTMRVGRVSAQRAIDKQAKIFNVVALLGLKVLTLNLQIKLGGGQMQEGFRRIWAAHGQEFVTRMEEADDAWLYVQETCPQCAGKRAEEPICWLFTGTLQASTKWLTGRDLEIVQTDCRAMGHAACVWRISKTPKD